MPEPGSPLRSALLLACVLVGAAASAQSPLPAAAAASAAERAQKETDRTMYWIRVLATTPAPVKTAPAPAAKPAAVAASTAPKPVTEARDRAKAAPATVPARPDAATTVAVAQAAPAPVAAGRAASPGLVPANDLPEPSALSSRHADESAARMVAAPAPEAAPAPVAEPDPGLIQVKSVMPEFPLNVVARVHKGNVEVRFEVEPGGTVIDASVMQSSNPRLNVAALEAVRQWRFKPTSASHTAAVNLVFDVDK